LYLVIDKTESTFEIRGSSYVDLTIVNNKMLRHVTDWSCGIQESCSDHKILIFNLGMVIRGSCIDKKSELRKV